jgi:methylthioribose-1-phosphate isomerase
MLKRMKNLIKKIDNMSPKELEEFQQENAKRARHILHEDYSSCDDIHVIGEEVLK